MSSHTLWIEEGARVLRRFDNRLTRALSLEVAGDLFDVFTDRDPSDVVGALVECSECGGTGRAACDHDDACVDGQMGEGDGVRQWSGYVCGHVRESDPDGSNERMVFDAAMVRPCPNPSCVAGRDQTRVDAAVKALGIKPDQWQRCKGGGRHTNPSPSQVAAAWCGRCHMVVPLTHFVENPEPYLVDGRFPSTEPDNG